MSYSKAGLGGSVLESPVTPQEGRGLGPYIRRETSRLIGKHGQTLVHGCIVETWSRNTYGGTWFTDTQEALIHGHIVPVFQPCPW